MAIRYTSTKAEESQPSDDLATAVFDCQSCYLVWASETDPQRRPVLSQEYHASAERLLVLIRPDLERMAHSWLRSGMAPDIESLILNLFACLLLALPGLRIDPTQNVRGLLRRVAWRGIYDLHGLDISDGSRRQSKKSPIENADTEARDTEMWPRSVSKDDFSFSSDHNQDYIDRESFDAEDRLIYSLDSQACLNAIYAFWETELPAIDREIVRLRMSEMAFKDIAQELGRGWEAAAVRQRHHRIIERTRKHLRQLGLINDEESSSL